MANTISIAGGGTSASTAAGARTNLGLGSMAVQDASNVAISGGSIAGDGSGLNSLNASNLASGTVPQARKSSEQTTSLTGNQDNLSFSDADMLRCDNASLLTIRGLAAGVSGQRLTIVSVGAGQVDRAHQNTNSTAANRLINTVTSGVTSLAAGKGAATYEYDGTTQRWRLLDHYQGRWITPAFNAGDFTANGSMTWTVAAGDVTVDAYMIIGNALMMAFRYETTTVGGTLNTLLLKTLPNGYTTASPGGDAIYFALDNGTVLNGWCFAASSTQLGFGKQRPQIGPRQRITPKLRE